MTKCMKDGCSAQAEVTPLVFVPPFGGELNEKKSLSFNMGVELCFDHFESFPAVDYVLTDANKKAAEIACRQSLKAPPDFSRAWSVPIRLDHELYLRFKRMTARQ